MGKDNIVDRIQRNTQNEPYFNSMADMAMHLEEICNCYISWDVVQEIENTALLAAEPIPCDACGRNVKDFDCECFADILLDGDECPTRWFRLCKECGEIAQLESLDGDTHIMFMFKAYPKTDKEWCNAWQQGYALENEPFCGAIQQRNK